MRAGLADAVSDDVPKYYRVKVELSRLIDGMAAGAPLPAERVLAERHHVARETLRQAMQELVAEGRVSRARGRGTFVALPKITLQLALRSFTSEITAAGRRPSSRVLDIVTGTDPEVAEQLALPPSTRLLIIKRIRNIDMEPVALEVSHLPANPYADLADEITEEASLYRLLRERHDVVLGEADEIIETVPASPHECRLLACDSGAPILDLRRITRDASGHPLEYVRAAYRGDRFRFATTMRPSQDPDDDPAKPKSQG